MSVRQKQHEVSLKEAVRQWVELCLQTIAHQKQEAQKNNSPKESSMGSELEGGRNE